jgi:hypothetical protein
MIKNLISWTNLINKERKLSKHMTISSWTQPLPSALMGLLDLTSSPELAILLVSFFSFKVEDGVMGLMSKAHFKTAFKGPNRLWEVLQNIHPLLRFQKTFFQNILTIFSENGKKFICFTAMDLVTRAPKKIQSKLMGKKYISEDTTLPLNALKTLNIV